MKERRERVRAKIRKYVGGKIYCTVCGYDTCEAAVHFHHRDPSEKKFVIRSSYCMSWEKVMAEIDKCIMLCANCHIEEHNRDVSPHPDKV